MTGVFFISRRPRLHLFEAVKQSVITRQAAERYGLNVNRNGMAVCPFHRDRHPSMKVDRRYYCFGCGATGDVIDFVSLLHGISAMVGKGSVNHNSRKFKAENVDAGRSYLNIDYCNENIKKVYHELFDEALARYNAKQTRADRKIANYYEKIRSSKQENRSTN